MRRIIAAALVPLVFLVGCGAPAEDTTTDGYETPEYTEPTNGTETEGPVTEYENPYGENLNVFTITEQGKTCIVAAQSSALTMYCF